MDHADDLYGLPLERFVPARDELAKRLREDGDREGAARVKGLRKPTLAAWAVNQVMRTQRAATRELAAAGAALRDAQSALLAGEGSAEDLRAAGERERAAVNGLVKAARGLLTAGGGNLSEAVLREVGETLHAVATDQETRDAALAGRLERERRAAGLGGEPGTMPPASATRRPKPRSGAKRRGAQAVRERERAEGARVAELRAARDAAARARQAEREHARALARLEAADAALEGAKQARDAVRAAEREARRALDRATEEAQRLAAAAAIREGPLGAGG